ALFKSPDQKSAADRIDFHIASSPINLGIVQGFTTTLTGVSGVAQASMDVTGTADDPHADGAITIQNGAFTVAPTGVGYTNLEGRIDLKPDRIHIERLAMLDNHRSPMSIEGDLGIHEREVGGVNLSIQAQDFKVVDNTIGNVRVNSNLRLAGD